MTLYQPGIRGVQEVAYGKTGQVIYAWPELNGAVIDPSSTTVSILRPGETEDSSPTVSASASVTEDGTTKRLSYTLDASNTGTWYLGTGFRAVFRYTASSIPRATQVAFDIVRVPLAAHPPCFTTDVTNGNTALEAAMKQESLTVDGTTSGDPDASRFINEAWGDIVAMLRARGTLPGRISSADMLTPLLRARARIKLYAALFIGGGSQYKELIVIEEKSEQSALTSLALYYDDNDAGEANQQHQVIQPRLRPSYRQPSTFLRLYRGGVR